MSNSQSFDSKQCEAALRANVITFVDAGTRFSAGQLEIRNVSVHTTRITCISLLSVTPNLIGSTLAGRPSVGASDWLTTTSEEFEELRVRMDSECGATQNNCAALLATVKESIYESVALHGETLYRHPAALHYVAQCSNCHGGGDMSCPTCGGVGQTTCFSCGGRGRKQCSTCGGRGSNTVNRFEYNPSTRMNENRTILVSCGCGGGTVTCGSCAGSGTNICHSCSASGRVVCSSCVGTGLETTTITGQSVISCVTDLQFIESNVPGWVRDRILPLAGSLDLLKFATPREQAADFESRNITVRAVSTLEVPYGTVSVVLNGRENQVFLLGLVPEVVVANNLLEHLLENDLTELDTHSRGFWFYPYRTTGIKNALSDFMASEVNQAVINGLADGLGHKETASAVSEGVGDLYIKRCETVMNRVISRSVLTNRLTILLLSALLGISFSALVAILIGKSSEHLLRWDATEFMVLGTDTSSITIIAVSNLFMATVVTALLGWFHREWLHTHGTEIFLKYGEGRRKMVGWKTGLVAFLCSLTLTAKLFFTFPLTASLQGSILGIEGVIPPQRITVAAPPSQSPYSSLSKHPYSRHR